MEDMIKNRSELEELKVLMDINFKMLNKKISKRDKEISKILKKIKTIQEYVPILDTRSIEVKSYLDD